MSNQQHREQFDILEFEAKLQTNYRLPTVWALGRAFLGNEDGPSVDFWGFSFGSLKSAAVLFGASEQATPGEPRIIGRQKLTELLPLFEAFDDEDDVDQRLVISQIKNVLLTPVPISVGGDNEQTIVLAWVVDPDEPDNNVDSELLALIRSGGVKDLDEDLENTLPYPDPDAVLPAPKSAVG